MVVASTAAPKSKIYYYSLPITNYQLPITNYQVPITTRYRYDNCLTGHDISPAILGILYFELVLQTNCVRAQAIRFKNR